MAVKIYPFSNGQKYGWSKLRSLFDFFFPDLNNFLFGERIRCEMSSSSDGQENYYTFRAFAVSSLGKVLYPIKKFFKELERIRIYVPQLEIVRGIKIPMGIHLAVAFDAAQYQGNTSGTSYTGTPRQVCTGTNRLLLIGGEGDQHANGANNITTATFAGVDAGTVTSTYSGVDADRWTYLFYMPNPATGSTNDTVVNSSRSALILINSSSYSGCSQSSTPDNTANGTGASSTSYSQSLTPVADNCWVAFSVNGSSGTAISNGTNTTLRAQQTGGANGIADNNAAIHPAASTTLAVSAGSALTWASIMVSIAPFSAAPPAVVAKPQNPAFLYNFL